MRKHFLDTNALLDYHDRLDELDNFILSSISLIEIENIKTSATKDEEIKHKARAVSRYLANNDDAYDVVVVHSNHYNILDTMDLPLTNDNLIVACAYSIAQAGKVLFISRDLNCRIVAQRIFGLDVGELFVKDMAPYTGWLEVAMDDHTMSDFYQNMENGWGLLTNQYLVIKNTNGEIVDKFKWDGEEFHTLKYKSMNSKHLGRIKAVNHHQELLFDMLQDNTPIKVTTGKMGSGKDYCMLAHCMNWLESGKYTRLIWLRNVIEVRDSGSIGFLPGTQTDKLLPYASPLHDHLGGQYGLEALIKDGTIELQHLSTIRGRDFKNAIVYCSEAEYLTKEHMQLIMGRVGEGSALLVNGDLKQVDSHIYERNNGLCALIEACKGKDNFGFVQLVNTERSKIAAMADLLD